MSERKEEYWSRFADTFDEDQNYIVGGTVQQAIIGRLSEERDVGEVVELGCGRGYFTKAIAANAKQVLATDLSEEMVEMARTELEGFRNVTVEKADCENTGFPSERFDTVVMVNIVHFIENPDKCLQESYRILKTGGLLLLADYTGYGMRWFEKMKLGIKFLKRWGMPPRYGQSALSPDGFSSLVENAGFKVEEVQLIADKINALYLRGRKT